MLNKKKIIAIFTKNYFLEELVVLLEDEGLEIKKVNDFHKLDKLVSNKILLIYIDSKHSNLSNCDFDLMQCSLYCTALAPIFYLILEFLLLPFLHQVMM